MKTINIFSSFFLVFIGVIFCVASSSLGIGSIRAPGPGLIPFGTGALLILLSLAIAVETYLGGKVERKSSPFSGRRWRVALSVLLSLFAYAFLLNILGFILTTFSTLTFLFKIPEKQSWKTGLGASALTTTFAYLVFGYFLKISFPIGFIGF